MFTTAAHFAQHEVSMAVFTIIIRAFFYHTILSCVATLFPLHKLDLTLSSIYLRFVGIMLIAPSKRKHPDFLRFLSLFPTILLIRICQLSKNLHESSHSLDSRSCFRCFLPSSFCTSLQSRTHAVASSVAAEGRHETGCDVAIGLAGRRGRVARAA